MRELGLKSNNLRTNLWMKWWLFWLGYGLVPSLLVQVAGQFSYALVENSAFGLLSIRTFLLFLGYWILPANLQNQLKESLFQSVSPKVLVQVLGVFGFVLLLGVGLFTWVESVLQVAPLENGQAILPASIWQMITITMLAPIVEEMWFRHWLLGQPAKGNQSPWLGVIYGWQEVASVVVFGLLHLSADYWGVKAFIWASVMGLFLLWVRRYTGSLTVCMVLHAVHNSLLLLF